MHGEGYSHSQGLRAGIIGSEGVRADGDVLPTYIRIWTDGRTIGTGWPELHEAAHIDAFALSPDEEQIAVSKDGDVFLLPADGSQEGTRLDQDENQDHRVLGWF